MALFVDGNPSQPGELSPYESSILETAHTEGIDLVAKGTVAALEIGLEVQRFLLRTPGGDAYRLENVAVTDALRLWHIVQTLAVTYRDAYHQQLNDRYLKKWKTYEQLGNKAASLLYQLGVGIVEAPLPRPAMPVVDQVAGTQPGLNWYVAVSWVSEAGAESGPSEPIGYRTLEGSALRVRAVDPPPAAAGWHVYLSTSNDQFQRQTETPLAPGASWTMPDTGLAAGQAPSAGQRPDSYVRRSTVMLRG